MDETTFQPPPKAHEAILADTRKIGFQGWCWPPAGALLRVMTATKPGGRMLEIGTGTGVGTCWLLDGMDAEARLMTVDISAKIQAIARTHLGMDPRLTILSEDAAATIGRESPNSFDLIFADGGAGKHTLLDEALALLRPGGIYICDDTKPIPCGRPSTPQRFHHSWRHWLRARTFVGSTSTGRAAQWLW
jgi:predicted O-methyltransferase YrrM